MLIGSRTERCSGREDWEKGGPIEVDVEGGHGGARNQDIHLMTQFEAADHSEAAKH